ncbi:MAG: fumarylacetoacetate hydrolase family protein [SAR324 cluster bacterium]|nr:fumarylacetoacetate hydrolase family protein [SAR324 cluster bacterium]
MRFVTFLEGTDAQLGVLDDGQKIIRVKSVFSNAPEDIIELIQLGQAGMLSLREGMDQVLESDKIPFDDVHLLAPIPRPIRNIMCVGKNYYTHAHEFAQSGFDKSASKTDPDIPVAPIIFTKAPSSVIGTREQIVKPRKLGQKVDYEAELGVVIGKGGRNISKEIAYDHVWGYTIINDMTARDIQAKHKQWFIGKSLDTFCPMGPWIATADEVDPENLDLKCWVNGELRQDAQTKDLIFDIPTLIETLSEGITLIPGDIIATGTPAGVGIGFDPPIFLKEGDRIQISITGLGELENTIVDEV